MADTSLPQLVQQVLTSNLPINQLSKLTGIPRSRLSRILQGKLHSDIHPELPRRLAANSGLLTPEQVHTILTSELSNSDLARRLDVSTEAVSQARRGKTYKNLFPELPRTGARHFTSGGKRRLTPEQKLEIATSSETCKVLAQRYNRCEETIRHLRSSIRRQQQAPAAGGISCHHCLHFNPHRSTPCTMGFPEAIDPAFAADCSLYDPSRP